MRLRSRKNTKSSSEPVTRKRKQTEEEKKVEKKIEEKKEKKSKFRVETPESFNTYLYTDLTDKQIQEVLDAIVLLMKRGRTNVNQFAIVYTLRVEHILELTTDAVCITYTSAKRICDELNNAGWIAGHNFIGVNGKDAFFTITDPSTRKKYRDEEEIQKRQKNSEDVEREPEQSCVIM